MTSQNSSIFFISFSLSGSAKVETAFTGFLSSFVISLHIFVNVFVYIIWLFLFFANYLIEKHNISYYSL